MISLIKLFVASSLFFQLNCSKPTTNAIQTPNRLKKISVDTLLEVGAAQFDLYLPQLADKKVAMMVNQTSVIEGTHIVDLLIEKGIAVQKIFAPEHGFRGTADAGEKLEDGRDAKTGLPLISLYGKKKKPNQEDLEDIDIIIFDIQDVGARFYTYISSMHYLMEACVENGKQFMVLDRPNPNGHYVDGPMLDPDFSSFVGMHPIPVVHGMTVGEYAQMVNGEGWLSDGQQCELTVIPCKNYDHQDFYELPIKPSPNLPNIRSIYLYPSLCFLEGTQVSVGRGTNTQFQVYGHPDFTDMPYAFTPVPMPGAKYPKLKEKECYGLNLTKVSLEELQNKARLDLSYLINAYKAFPEKEKFFLKTNFIDKLAGSDALRKAIIAGKTEEEIRATWQEDLAVFRANRAKYLLYQ